MEPMLMARTALALLTLAALGGLLMAGIRFGRNVNPPSGVAMLHGLLAGAALTLLIYAHFTAGLPALAGWATLILVVAAAGGVLLNLSYHARGQLLPSGIVLVHAAVSVAAYVLLVMAVFGIR